MRRVFVAVTVLAALAGCGGESTSDGAAAAGSATPATPPGLTSGFADCAAVFKDGQPTPKAPPADTNGMSCSVAKGEIVAVAGIRCRDDSFLWASHETGATGWGVAGAAWHAGDYHIDTPAYSAALGACVS